MNSPLVLEHIYKYYGSGAAQVRALANVSLEVRSGEWLAMMGPSGSGKTTLLSIMGCLDRVSNGRMLIGGMDVASIRPSEFAVLRAEKLGFVFQRPRLIPHLTAMENIMLAQYFHSTTDDLEARRALRHVGLESASDRLPCELSGGEQQRVAIARACINDPEIILADEPTGFLDEENQSTVLQLLADIHKTGRTIVMVTHNPDVAKSASRQIRLSYGQLTDERS
jgi:putative ABC transport system ATP-binding protein